MTRKLALLGLALTALVAVPVWARPYPVNTCVSNKQEAAGTYCNQALKAWSKWELDQNSTRRDGTLTSAASHLAKAWSKAEAKSSAEGVDCADTTLSADAAVRLTDSAVGAIVAAVNDGLDLGSKPDATCGANLLAAAGKKCANLLGVESTFIKSLEKDPTGAKRDADKAKVSASFSKSFSKIDQKGCSTTVTSDGLEGLVDDLTDSLITKTTVSPNVADTGFTTISPTGTTQYLGKAITPVCMNGTPYNFFVKRGSVNKLLMYYQGGGACWDALTCGLPTCDTTASSSDNPGGAPSGFFDLSNPNNPFKDWNIVFVSYCSCDVHFGDAAQDYTPTLHVEHRGYDNSRIAEKWAREHFVSPDQIFVTGSSAGAYGAWFNAPLHEMVWPASRFQVLADAGNGVITQDFLQNNFGHWDFVKNIPSTIPGVLESITNGTGIVGYTKAVTSFFPKTRWAEYATAFDGGSGGQTGFYAIMLNNNNPLAALTWWTASCKFNEVMRSQDLELAASIPSNYRYYIGTGSRHTMWFFPKVYNDTTGGVPLLVDWVNAMLTGGPGWTNVEATDEGLLLPGDPRPPMIPTPPFLQVGSDVKVVCGASPSGAFVDGPDTN
jgi:hypothetical protein